MKIKLYRPHTHNGVEVSELEINVENLTLAEYEKTEREFRALNPRFVGPVEVDSGFLKLMAARAINQTPEFFENMSIPDYIRIRMAVQGFLLSGTVSEI